MRVVAEGWSAGLRVGGELARRLFFVFVGLHNCTESPIYTQDGEDNQPSLNMHLANAG